jgi:hypothetical protein
MIIKSMGQMHFFAGRTDEAEQMFELADKEAGGTPQIRMYIAEFYMRSIGDNPRGLKWLNRIVEREAKFEHSKVERFLGRIDFVEDARTMIAALSSDPNKSWVRSRRVEWSEVTPAKRRKLK